MRKQHALAISQALGGEVWEADQGDFVVSFHRPDGALIVLTDTSIAEYTDDEAFEAGRVAQKIAFRSDFEDYWVIQDEAGDVLLADFESGYGWASEEEAEHEARGIASRTGLRTWVRPQRDDDAVRAESA